MMGARRADVAGDELALLRGGGVVASRSRRLPVSTRSCRPVSGSTTTTSPTSGKVSSAVSRTSQTMTSLRTASSRRAPLQSRGPRRSLTTTISARSRACRRVRESASPSLSGDSGIVKSSGRSATSRTCRSTPTRPTRPWRGGTKSGSGWPCVSSPRRLPRRLATWPTASTTPSATSALRRSAVPKPIECEASNRSQVVSARSATCSRTCGSFMRAVAFQSIRRTSSPGW